MKKILLNIFITYFLLLFIFCFLLSVVSTFKLCKTCKNLTDTVMILKQEGTYPSVGLPWRKIILDNYTESIIINTVFYINPERPIESAFINLRYASSLEPMNQILNLENMANGRPGKEFGYERYWHGYMVYVRPLFAFLTYAQIRIILALVVYSLFALLIYRIWRQFGILAAFIHITAFAAVDLFSIAISMQLSNVFIVALIGSIYLLTQKYGKHGENYIVFFIFGAITSFIDLLTAPLVCLGLMLCVESLKKTKNNIIFNAFSWLVGYIGLWAGKWIITSIFFSNTAISIAIEQIINRTINKPDANFSHIQTIKLNIFQLIGYSRESKLMFLAAITLFTLFFLRYRKLSHMRIAKVTMWVIIAIFPYIWYAVAANHSYIHVWYTYRSQLMTVIAGLLIYFEFIDEKLIKQDLCKLKSHFSKLYGSIYTHSRPISENQ